MLWTQCECLNVPKEAVRTIHALCCRRAALLNDLVLLARDCVGLWLREKCAGRWSLALLCERLDSDTGLTADEIVCNVVRDVATPTVLPHHNASAAVSHSDSSNVALYFLHPLCLGLGPPPGSRASLSQCNLALCNPALCNPDSGRGGSVIDRSSGRGRRVIVRLIATDRLD